MELVKFNNKTKNYFVKETDYSLADGFAWVVFTHIDMQNELTLQACLCERAECEDERRRFELTNSGAPIFKKEIDWGDTGMDWGICGDVNSECFEKFGENECRLMFRREMRKVGIRIV